MQKVPNAFNVLGIIVNAYGEPYNKKYIEDEQFADNAIKIRYMNKVKFCSIQKDTIKKSNLSEEEKEKKISDMDKNIEFFKNAFEELNTLEKRKKYIERWRIYIEKNNIKKKEENKRGISIQTSIQKMAENGANGRVEIVHKRANNYLNNRTKIEHGYFIPLRDKQGIKIPYIIQDDEYGRIEYLGYFLYETTEQKGIGKSIGKYSITVGEEQVEFFYKNGFNVIGKRLSEITPQEEAVILKKVLERNFNLKRKLYEILNEEMKTTSKEQIINLGTLKRTDKGIVRVTTEEQEIAIKEHIKRKRFCQEREEEEKWQK